MKEEKIDIHSLSTSEVSLYCTVPVEITNSRGLIGDKPEFLCFSLTSVVDPNRQIH